MSTAIKLAREVMAEALASDPGFRLGYVANIAMLLSDRHGITDPAAREQAAVDILDLLFLKEFAGFGSGDSDAKWTAIREAQWEMLKALKPGSPITEEAKANAAWKEFQKTGTVKSFMAAVDPGDARYPNAPTTIRGRMEGRLAATEKAINEACTCKSLLNGHEAGCPMLKGGETS